MSENVIAGRYAAALLAAADDKGVSIGELTDELRMWSDWLASDDPGAEALLNPVLPPDRQWAFLRALVEAAGSSDLMRGLLRVCLEKRRLQILDKITAAVQAALDARTGSVKGTAVAAFALDDATKQTIAEKVGAIVNKKTELNWQEDRSLLSGFRVQIGHTVWDASLKHQLDRLGETIRKGVS